MVKIRRNAAANLFDLWEDLRKTAWDCHFDLVAILEFYALRAGAEPEVARDRHMAILAWLYGKRRVREKKPFQPPRRQRIRCHRRLNHRLPTVAEEP